MIRAGLVLIRAGLDLIPDFLQAPTMAALRHGEVRRLGGSMLRRAEAEGRRRLGPRLMHTEEVS